MNFSTERNVVKKRSAAITEYAIKIPIDGVLTEMIFSLCLFDLCIVKISLSQMQILIQTQTHIRS